MITRSSSMRSFSPNETAHVRAMMPPTDTALYRKNIYQQALCGDMPFPNRSAQPDEADHAHARGEPHQLADIGLVDPVRYDRRHVSHGGGHERDVRHGYRYVYRPERLLHQALDPPAQAGPSGASGGSQYRVAIVA